ncbi:Crp/Fnr family transcriptional regulator [Afifella pfennigii]|uniref:Crp/Fnr family transcriptional regulator n=1 Tax=Afifella pfennigii TaxID=209897 RepID=UPI00047BD908|nr:Crp/Fnr family transcriptional regulator [Afifella pfennigii]
MVARDGSCLIRKISHYLDLTEDEKRLLARLEETSRKLRRDEILIEEDGELREMFVVSEGWLYTYTHTLDGRRQVFEVHFPGDIVGASQAPFERIGYGVAAATEAIVCPFPKRSLNAIFSRSPALTALFYAFAVLDHATILDRLRATGRMGAAERVLLVLLQCLARLRITDPDRQDGLDMPLRQELIGDMVGLSNISVSHALKELAQAGLIERDARHFSFPDLQRAQTQIDFSDRYYAIDTSWFPRQWEIA